METNETINDEEKGVDQSYTLEAQPASSPTGYEPRWINWDSRRIAYFVIDGLPLFITKHVCAVLGIEHYRDMLDRLQTYHKGCRVVIDTVTRGPQEMSTLTLAGLFYVTTTSRKPEAKLFEKYLATEVLNGLLKPVRIGTTVPQRFGSRPLLANPEATQAVEALMRAMHRNGIQSARGGQLLRLTLEEKLMPWLIGRSPEAAGSALGKLLTAHHGQTQFFERCNLVTHDYGCMSKRPCKSQSQFSKSRERERH